MRSFYAVVPLTLALRAAALYEDWHFGNMFAVGPTTNNAQITKATYSLVPPSIPCGTTQEKQNDAPWLSIWVGISASMSDQAADLFQPLLNWSPDQESQGCPATAQEWCVATSTYHLFTVDDKKITQKVSIEGKQVSEQSDDKSINPTFLYSSNECYLGTCGTVAGYSWDRLTIHLSEADPNFGENLNLMNATSSGFTTSDQGKTWYAESIKINEDYFYSDGSQKECSA
ncbi:hypothetical protein BDV27DRAFT_143559 [Aspergillus caelatus]|uniref:Concanavalin A-like lectin/glucanase domain-containing protein n=1 Tax=Aspergillus caelatus TaxID=61420 RepID=A0A5N7A9M7_9EURO|nr:uncharacterized protein BDV27DRAFT_143559 [Aspergillus caelatus]KAE8366577.1 hypothetical protein BDV27DRAFT_143559 [Aspergillus caelatus]